MDSDKGPHKVGLFLQVILRLLITLYDFFKLGNEKIGNQNSCRFAGSGFVTGIFLHFRSACFT